MDTLISSGGIAPNHQNEGDLYNSSSNDNSNNINDSILDQKPSRSPPHIYQQQQQQGVFSPKVVNTTSKTTTSTSTTSSFDTMFQFQYNNIVSIVLLPSLFIILLISGRVSLYLASLLTLVTYVIDLFNQPELTIISIWVGLFVVDVNIMLNGMLLVHHLFVNIFLLFNMAMVLALFGVWITLQFKTLSNRFPNLFSTMERILMACLIYPTSVIFTWYLVTMNNSIESAPYYLMFILCIQYYLYGLPLRSFRIRSSKQLSTTNDFILGRFESMMMTMNVILYPSLLYYSLYHNVFFDSFLNISNYLILLTLPATFVFILSKYGSLWWLLPDFWDQVINNNNTRKRDVNSFGFIFKIGNIFKIVCLAVLVGCLQYRFIFNSPTFAIALQLSSISRIFVTIAIYSMAIIFYLIFFNYDNFKLTNQTLSIFTTSSSSSSSTTTTMISVNPSLQIIFYLLATLFSVSITYLLEAPFWVYIFSVTSAVALTFYLFNQRYHLSYSLFIITSTVCLQWLIYNSFWIEFQLPHPDMSLQQFTIFISALYVVSMLAIQSIGHPVLGLLLVLKALVLTFIEVALNSTRDSYSGDTGNDLYPNYLIYLTSFIGIYINHSLSTSRNINPFMKAISDSFYISKVIAIILFNPIVTSIIPCYLYTLLLYSCFTINQVQKPIKQYSMMQFIIGVLLSIVYIKDIPIKLISIFIGRVIDGTPSIPILLSAFLLSISIILFPLAFKQYPKQRQLKSLFILTFFTSLILLYFNPDMKTDKSLSWTNWYLVISLVIFIIGIINSARMSNSNLFKLIFSIVIGIMVGLYVSYNYFNLPTPVGSNRFNSTIKNVMNPVLLQQLQSTEKSIFTLISFIFVSLSLLLTYSHWPSLTSYKYMVAIYSFFMVLFPITYVIIGNSYTLTTVGTIFSSPQSLSRYIDNLRISLIGLCIGLNLLLIIYIFNRLGKLKLSLRFLKTNSNRQQQQQQQHDMIGNQSLKKFNTQLQQEQHLWIKYILNFATLFSYVASISVNIIWLNGSELSVLVLSPILLFIEGQSIIPSFLKSSKRANQHLHQLKSHQSSQQKQQKQQLAIQRYTPLVQSISIVLIVMSLKHLIIQSGIDQHNFEWYKLFGVSSSFWGFWWVVKNWALFIFSIPSVYYLSIYLERLQVQKQFTWLIFTPMALIASLFSDIFSINLLGIMGIFGAITQYLLSSKVKQKGNQVL